MSVAVSPSSVRPGPAAERVELILGHLDRLPSLPPVVAKLLAVTSSDESSARDVGEVIELDAALTAGLLRLVRRADLGAPRGTTTVARAVTLLGFQTVRNAVLTTQFFDTLSRRDAHDSAEAVRKGLWRHSLAVACAAELLGGRIGLEAGKGEAFVCGLLHDIGKIALDVCLPKSYTRIAERVMRRRECICDVEREVLGLDHTIAGKRLVSRWGLPRPVVECAWLHHQGPEALPSSVSCARLVKVIHLADNLIRRAGTGFSGYQHVCDIDALAVELGLQPDSVNEVVELVPQRLAPYLELVGLDESCDSAPVEEVSQEVERRLRQANATLATSNRELKLRAAWLDSIERFSRKLTEHDRVGDVCAAAAEAVQRLFPAETVVAFAAGGSGARYLHAGWYDASSRQRSTSVTELGGSDTLPLHGARTPGLIPAPSGSCEIWERCGGPSPSGELWMLPLRTDTMTGGILFVADEDALHPYRAATDDCAGLARAIALAISSSWARVEAERMAEELLDLNRRFREAQAGLLRVRSMSMVAEMAAGAAHELNNPLAVISGRAQMELPAVEDPERRRGLEIIVEQTKKASRIVQELMNFAKPEPPTPILQPLGGVLEALYQHWRDVLGERSGKLKLAVEEPDVSVYADAAQVMEILNAVMSNAVEAADSAKGTVQINSPSRLSDETVRIVVEDNGKGMTPDVVEHALDPFFSDRPAGRGRGLGLSRAYRLAEVNGGRLWIDSTPNVGTTVSIELPARPHLS